MLRLKSLQLLKCHRDLGLLPNKKLLINTINAHSYNVAQHDSVFAEALSRGDVLIPDGVSIVMATKWMKVPNAPKERCTGWDAFMYEMKKTNECKGRVLFVGSSEGVLELIRKRVSLEFPDIVSVETFSPPYKSVFSKDENDLIIQAVNASNPDLLCIGMTAPKQEKWAYTHWQELNIHCHTLTIGAVFDFYAGTVKRAPSLWQKYGFEWLYRLLKEPLRMWKRYIIGNILFIINIIKIG